jgi:ubiquinone biosynthesis monooxygenase Coq7
MIDIDRLIGVFDRGLRTLFAPPQSARTTPGGHIPDKPLQDHERRLAAALMRVNHTGEVCAQALYEGQALTARDSHSRTVLEQAAREEGDHLAWTGGRIAELGGRTSWLNPVFYAGSFALGAAAGLAGDRWSLGFLAETERQVVEHLQGHLKVLPAEDQKSRAIVEQMSADEARHAGNAVAEGGAELPPPVRLAMRLSSKVMTKTTFWL